MRRLVLRLLALCGRALLGAALALLSALLVLSGYGLCKLRPFSEPSLLPLTWLDRAIPLVPASVWVYGSMPSAFFVAWALVPDARLGRRLFLGLGAAAATCWLFFAFLPTEYPRHLFPVFGGDASSLELLELRRLDDPANCFPSMHVALAACLALTMLEYGLAWPARALVVAWALAVAASTLTTKQHYALDVPAGALVGAFAFLLARWAARPGRPPLWRLGLEPIRTRSAENREVLATLRRKVEARSWSVDDLSWPERGERLPEDLVRFVSQVVYVEEIAAQNFELLARAAKDEDLRVLYARFSEEERRHAEGLRRLLLVHGARPGPPGLGCAMLLHHFDSLDPESDADALLVALSIPVFETFLDAGTIPFLRNHPALAGEAFDALVRNICRDESSHLAVNWNVGRDAARSVKAVPLRAWGGLRLLANPAILRGALATPFLAADVYGHAARLGFDFRALFPSFRRLFRLHRVHRELAWFPPWFLFRVFVVCGAAATLVAVVIQRISPRLLRGLARLATGSTDAVARLFFGERLAPGPKLTPGAASSAEGEAPCA